jgi:hypothetical protein
VVPGYALGTGWNNANVSLKVMVTDNLSGVDHTDKQPGWRCRERCPSPEISTSLAYLDSAQQISSPTVGDSTAGSRKSINRGEGPAGIWAAYRVVGFR